jgi:hypothetical protein
VTHTRTVFEGLNAFVNAIRGALDAIADINLSTCRLMSAFRSLPGCILTLRPLLARLSARRTKLHPGFEPGREPCVTAGIGGKRAYSPGDPASGTAVIGELVDLLPCAGLDQDHQTKLVKQFVPTG